MVPWHQITQFPGSLLDSLTGKDPGNSWIWRGKKPRFWYIPWANGESSRRWRTAPIISKDDYEPRKRWTIRNQHKPTIYNYYSEMMMHYMFFSTFGSFLGVTNLRYFGDGGCSWPGQRWGIPVDFPIFLSSFWNLPGLEGFRFSQKVFRSDVIVMGKHQGFWS